MKALLRRALIPMTALALVGIGAAWLWSWPAGVLIVGGLLWLDLFVGSLRTR